MCSTGTAAATGAGCTAGATDFWGQPVATWSEEVTAATGTVPAVVESHALTWGHLALVLLAIIIGLLLHAELSR